MNVKKALAIGLGIMLVVEAVYVGWLLSRLRETKTQSQSETSRPMIISAPTTTPIKDNKLIPADLCPPQIQPAKVPDVHWQKIQELKKKVAANPHQPDVLLMLAELCQREGSIPVHPLAAACWIKFSACWIKFSASLASQEIAMVSL